MVNTTTITKPVDISTENQSHGAPKLLLECEKLVEIDGKMI